MELPEAAEVQLVVGDERVDERPPVVQSGKWKVESGKIIQVFMEQEREVRREGGLGCDRHEAAFLQVEQRFARTAVVQWLNTQVAGDGEKEGDGHVWNFTAHRTVLTKH